MKAAMTKERSFLLQTVWKMIRGVSFLFFCQEKFRFTSLVVAFLVNHSVCYTGKYSSLLSSKSRDTVAWTSASSGESWNKAGTSGGGSTASRLSCVASFFFFKLQKCNYKRVLPPPSVSFISKLGGFPNVAVLRVMFITAGAFRPIIAQKMCPFEAKKKICAFLSCTSFVFDYIFNPAKIELRMGKGNRISGTLDFQAMNGMTERKLLFILL